MIYIKNLFRRHFSHSDLLKLRPADFLTAAWRAVIIRCFLISGVRVGFIWRPNEIIRKLFATRNLLPGSCWHDIFKSGPAITLRHFIIFRTESSAENENRVDDQKSSNVIKSDIYCSCLLVSVIYANQVWSKPILFAIKRGNHHLYLVLILRFFHFLREIACGGLGRLTFYVKLWQNSL